MPTKYNMDYRRATYSSQIVSGQLTRKEALNKIKDPACDENSIQSDKDYISKKYDISKSEFDAMLNTPAKTYKDFPNDKKRIERFYRLYKKIFN